jgi:hypothetical protein
LKFEKLGTAWRQRHLDLKGHWLYPEAKVLTMPRRSQVEAQRHLRGRNAFFRKKPVSEETELRPGRHET